MPTTLNAEPPEKPAGRPHAIVPIRLFDGSWTWVDPDTAERFALWNWRLKDARGYVQITQDGQRHRLHRMVVDAPAGKVVHHVDGNPRHNWRDNLRLCDKAQDTWVRRKVENCSSRFSGVHWNARAGLWRAQITVKGITLSLGQFQSEESAARARDHAVMTLRDSDFWQLNLPDDAFAWCEET